MVRDESTSGSDRLSQFVSVPESAMYPDEDITRHTRNRGSLDSESPAYRAKHGATVHEKYGLEVGDVIKARKVQPLKTPSYKETRPQDTFQSPSGHWFLNKEQLYLIAGFCDQDLIVHRMTTFSGTGQERLQSTTIWDQSSGVRKRLADFVQIDADHHSGIAAAREPLCYGKGFIRLHWKGSCNPPPKKGGYVSLVASDTLVIGETGVELMGNCDRDSREEFLSLKNRLQNVQYLKAMSPLKRKREDDEQYTTPLFTPASYQSIGSRRVQRPRTASPHLDPTDFGMPPVPTSLTPAELDSSQIRRSTGLTSRLAALNPSSHTELQSDPVSSQGPMQQEEKKTRKTRSSSKKTAKSVTSGSPTPSKGSDLHINEQHVTNQTIIINQNTCLDHSGGLGNRPTKESNQQETKNGLNYD